MAGPGAATAADGAGAGAGWLVSSAITGLLAPPSGGCSTRALRPLVRSQFRSTSRAALQPAFTSQRHSVRILLLRHRSEYARSLTHSQSLGQVEVQRRRTSTWAIFSDLTERGCAGR